MAVERDKGSMVCQIYCIADELIEKGYNTTIEGGKKPFKPCGSSDAFTVYEHEDDSEAGVYYNAHCFSCKQNFSKSLVHSSSVASQLGIEGAEEGMMFNSATETLYPNEIYVVPVVFRKEYIIWKDRKKGGGFNGAFKTEAEAEAERATLESPDDYESMETAQHFVLVVSTDEDGEVLYDEAVISMSRTRLKVSRQLNTLVRMAGGDRFSKVYRLNVVQANSAAGDYFNFSVHAMGYCPDEVYKAAEKMYESVMAGDRDVQRENSTKTEKDESEY